MNRLFDVYIAVDWSARSKPSPVRPSPDALWVGERLASQPPDRADVNETYWSTRHTCHAYLRGRLAHHAALGRRVFIGFDVAYGYPAGFAAALGLTGGLPPWRLTWDELTRLIVDNPDNSNNRFDVAAALNARCGGPAPGPLWGCPAGRALPSLEIKSPAAGYPYPVRPGLALERLRRVDRSERGVQPVWKLIGSGSVGGQCLVGIPVVCRLRDDPALSAMSAVWPFETGFTPTPTPATGPCILHAEIWPGLVSDALDPDIAIRDRAQVRATVRWLSKLDEDGRLGALFAIPDSLHPEGVAASVEEEGWILGAGSG